MDVRIACSLDSTKGVTSSTRLLSLGVTRREIERAVRAGDLVRVRRNALVDGRAWREAAPWQRHEARARAVAASLDPEGAAVLTHHSALAIRGVALPGSTTASTWATPTGPGGGPIGCSRAIGR